MVESSARYQEYPPHQRLQRWIAYYWSFHAPLATGPKPHPIPPEAGITVTLVPSYPHPGPVQSITSGPQREAIEVATTPGNTIFGVRFWPGTGPAFLQRPPSQLVDGMFETKALAAELDAALCSATDILETGAQPPLAQLAGRLNSALQPLLPAASALDTTVLQAVFRLMDPKTATSNADLADQAGLSPRQFRRRFKTAVGLSLREFRRVRRVRATLVDAVLATTAAWVELAAENGYADQAHLCREFQQVASRSPGDYQRAIDHIDHSLVDTASEGL